MGGRRNFGNGGGGVYGVIHRGHRSNSGVRRKFLWAFHFGGSLVVEGTTKEATASQTPLGRRQECQIEEEPHRIRHTMDERGPKRARQQRDGGGGLPANGFGASFSRTSLAGCHLRVETSQKHLFIGMPVELNVSLLNDEDVVQHVTQDIHVSIMGEDGKVRPRRRSAQRRNRATV